jgi:hypothetical protein
MLFSSAWRALYHVSWSAAEGHSLEWRTSELIPLPCFPPDGCIASLGHGQLFTIREYGEHRAG